MASSLSPIGTWMTGGPPPAFDAGELLTAIQDVREPLHVVRAPSGVLGVSRAGRLLPEEEVNGAPSWPLVATLPALYPEWLGDRSFLHAHGVRFPYVAGAMANGIATAELVVEMARAGMLAFFGAAGLSADRVAEGLDAIEAGLAGTGRPWGANLIHSPNEPDLEEAVAGLYLRRGVRRVSASAYMGLTPAIVRYAATGLRADASGHIHREHHVFAKISRPEVAQRFLSPPPQEILDRLVQRGQLTAEEAALAARLPVAEDLIVESDSGGHTDNRPLASLFPVIQRLRDTLIARHGYPRPIRLGAAGGIGTPTAAASAFALGAAFVLTGSVNQGAVESGLSTEGKAMLAQAGLADVIMAPSADMFELGVKVQVLRRGTLFGSRALQLYALYDAHDSLEALPADVRERLEREILGQSCEAVWAQTRSFFAKREPREVAKAEADPKHKMALVFRWYLGLSSKWAIRGEAGRRMDFQIWCGPAMGAFNDWVAGSFLEPPEARTVVQIARNLLEGAAVVTRAGQLRACGVPVPEGAFRFVPRPLQ